MTKQCLYFGAAGFALASSLAATPAFAQENASVEDSVNDKNVIIVTATKRETTLQETPLPVTVIGGEAIVEQGIIKPTDLANQVPSLTYQEPPGGLPVIRIRGVGTSSANQTFEQSVSLFVDGVYKPRSNQYRDSLFDVERVEAIKGAQGVLFGKNTSVGAVSVVTKKPGDEFGGRFNASYEFELDSYLIGAAVDLPVSDILKFRVAGQFSDTGGHVRNVTLNSDQPQEDRWTVRGTTMFEPSDRFTATLMVQHSEFDIVGDGFQVIDIINPALAGLLGLPAPQLDVNTADGDLLLPDNFTFPANGSNQDSTDAILTLDFAASDEITLTSITSYSDLRYRGIQDIFFVSTPSPFLPRGIQDFNENFDQFTQELRFDYNGDNFDVITGVFFQEQNLSFSSEVGVFNAILPPGPPFGGFSIDGVNNTTLTQNLTSMAFFGQATFAVSDRLSVILGGRLSSEEKSVDLTRVFVSALGRTIATPSDVFGVRPANPATFTVNTPALLAPDGTVAGKISETYIDGALTLSYQATDDLLIYGSVSQGTKAGAFNNVPGSGVLLPTNFIVDEEVAQTAELGVKATFLGGDGFLALSAFYSEIDDFQDSVFDPNGGAVGTGAFVTIPQDVRSKGIEGEGFIKVTDGLRLSGNFSLVDAESKANGARLASAPTFTGNLGANYDGPISDKLDLLLGAGVTHNSGQLHRQTPERITPAQLADPTLLELSTGSFTLVDFHAGLRLSDSGIQARVDVKNAFDKRYVPFSFVLPVIPAATIGSTNRPRTISFSIIAPF